MSKKDFLEKLERKMQGMDEADIRGTLAYYEEMIEDRVEDGMSEEEAVESLGSVDEMLNEIRKFLPAVLGDRNVKDGFENIWIEDSGAGDITFYPSKDDSAYIECMESEEVKYDIRCEDGTLYIKRQDEEKWYKKLIKFSLIKDTKLRVYLPQKKYHSLYVKMNHGDVDIQDFHFQNTEIKNMAGDVRLCNLCGDVTVSCLAGDLEICGESYGEIEAKLTAGDLSVKEVSAKKINLVCTNGDITIERTFAGEIRVKSVNGDIELKSVDADHYYLENVTGDIEGSILRYKKMEAKSTMGDVKAVSDRNAEGTLYAKTVMGDIKIRVEEG